MLPQPVSFRPAKPSVARKCERGLCGILTYFPLVGLYSLTTWGLWAMVSITRLPERRSGSIEAILAITFYSLANWSYTVAVFTDPGTPALTDTYSDDILSITVKHNGQLRYCNKCDARKPDRAHHCSTCRRCVLKMDHHCPWLATCVGLRNYKFFLLFLFYVTLFCWNGFYISGSWFWKQLMTNADFENDSRIIHFILVSVLSGVFAVVLTFFISYHLYLTCKNRTTIESLEKTRYLSPVRDITAARIAERRSFDVEAPNNNTFSARMRDFGNTLTEIHANALPGVLRPEEGIPSPSSSPRPIPISTNQSPPPSSINAPLQPTHESAAHASLRQNLQHMDPEIRRQRAQYEAYLNERDSARLPHAFDLGWRRNMRAVFGSSVLLALLPVQTSLGDGWRWEVNEEWLRERERMRREREVEMERTYGPAAASSSSGQSQSQLPPPPGRRRSPGDGRGGRDGLSAGDGDSDEEVLDGNVDESRTRLLARSEGAWNDVPDEFLVSKGGKRL